MMSRAEFKPSTGRRPGVLVAALVMVMALSLAMFAVGRASVPQRQVTARYVDRMQAGVPVGFPGTPRGAAEAAAAYTQVLAAVGARDVMSRQALLGLIAVNGAARAVQPLVGPPSEGAAIAQTVVVRVWVPDTDLDVVVPEGREVAVWMLVCALSGTTADAAGLGTGLAGGWYVQPATARWSQGRWRLVGAERAVPVPPPDQRGTRRDGGPRDMQPLADVLGVRSWAPGTV